MTLEYCNLIRLRGRGGGVDFLFRHQLTFQRRERSLQTLASFDMVFGYCSPTNQSISFRRLRAVPKVKTFF